MSNSGKGKALFAFGEDGVRFVVGALFHEGTATFVIADSEDVPDGVAAQRGSTKLQVARIATWDCVFQSGSLGDEHPEEALVFSTLFDRTPFPERLDWDCGYSCKCTSSFWDLDELAVTSKSQECVLLLEEIRDGEAFKGAVRDHQQQPGLLLALHTTATALAAALMLHEPALGQSEQAVC